MLEHHPGNDILSSHKNVQIVLFIQFFISTCVIVDEIEITTNQNEWILAFIAILLRPCMHTFDSSTLKKRLPQDARIDLSLFFVIMYFTLEYSSIRMDQ